MLFIIIIIYVFILAKYVQLLTVSLILYNPLANILILFKYTLMRFLKQIKIMFRRYWYTYQVELFM